MSKKPVHSEIEILHRVCSTLETLGIPYMVTGSFAMHFHANPRMTRDVDIVIEVTEKDVTKLCSTFGSESYCDEDMAREAVRHRSMFNVIYPDVGFKVDFVIKKETEFAARAFSRKR